MLGRSLILQKNWPVHKLQPVSPSGRFAGQAVITAGFDPEAILAVKPGLSVSLEMSVEAPAEMQQALRQALVGRLTANGLQVADSQPLKLVARTSLGESYDVTYQLQLAAGNKTIRVTDRNSELAFALNGQTVWQAITKAGPPYFVRLKAGETIEQVVASNTKPNLDFFRDAKLPTHIVRPTGKPAYGRSMLTAQGGTRPAPGP